LGSLSSPNQWVHQYRVVLLVFTNALNIPATTSQERNSVLNIPATTSQERNSVLNIPSNDITRTSSLLLLLYLMMKL
jgi:hypothetical protein